jgi:ribonuclease BN (tRNA processing enzyme)
MRNLLIAATICSIMFTPQLLLEMPLEENVILPDISELKMLPQAEKEKKVGQKTLAKRTRIVLLGTGTPRPDPDRFGSSIAIVVDDRPYIVDFGPGVVRRAQAAVKLGVEGLEEENLSIAFCTHLHSDHTLGYADLILTPWIMNREEPLEVYGPKGLKAMTDYILKAYSEDINIRINGMGKANPTGYKVNVHEIKSGLIYKDQKVKVKAFPVKHGSWKEAYGYRFETPDLTIVISGDTVATENSVKNYDGCDVLIHEVYCQKNFDELPEDYQKYHSSLHTSSAHLAQIAKKIKPKLLVLIHQIHFYGSTPDDLLEEIREIYKGKVVYGNDLDIF